MTLPDVPDVHATRVLLVLGTSAGGVVRHVAQVGASLREVGADVRVAGPASVVGALGGLPWADVPIGPRPGAADVTVLRRLRALLEGADVVHAHGLRAGALTVLAARSRSRRRRPRVVVTLHNLPVGGRGVRAVSAVLERVVARGADVVLGVSGDLVARARARGARHTTRALVPAPTGPVVDGDRPQILTELGLGPSSRLVLTVARLAPQKGLDTLLDAACSLARLPAGRDVTWCVAGGGPLLERLRADAARRGAPVQLLGPRDDVPRLLAAADVVVSTAVWEGQPIAVQEALRAGCALVVTDAGGTREVVGDAAVLVPVGDAPAIAAEVATLLGDPQRVSQLRRDALARALTLPTPADVLGQLTQVYAGQLSRV